MELCERLDGLPLAIELAAAAAAAPQPPGPGGPARRPADPPRGRAPQAGQRHSALSTTIDWSYRLLSDDARDVFDRLGVFPASFDLDAVTAVTGGLDAGKVTNLLGDLVAKSLVVHDPESGRYVLLETIRLFASRRLDDSGMAAEVTELLRRHVVARATAAPRVQTWLSADVAAQSRDDLDNVRLAFDASLQRGDSAPPSTSPSGSASCGATPSPTPRGAGGGAERPGADPRDRLWTLILAADVGLGAGDPRMMRDAAEQAAQLVTRLDDAGGAVIASIYAATTHLAHPPRWRSACRTRPTEHAPPVSPGSSGWPAASGWSRFGCSAGRTASTRRSGT